jgi:hypothetical protein
VPPLTTPSSSAASPFASAAAGGPPPVHQVNANVAFCMMPPALAATAERQNSSPTGSPGTGMRGGGASSSSPGGMMHSASSSEQQQQQMFAGGSSVPPSPMPTSVAAAAAAVYMHDPVQLFLGGLCYEYRPEHVAWILSCGLYCDRVPLYYINPSQVTMFVPPNQQNQNMASHAAMMSPGGAMMYGMNGNGNNGNALNSKGRKGGNAGCAIVTVERDVHLALVQNLTKRILCTKHGCFVGATPHAVEHYKTMNAGELKNGPKHAVVIELRRDTSTSNPSGVHPMYHRSQAHAFGSAPGTAVMDGEQQQSFAGEQAQQQFHDGSLASSSHFQHQQQQQHSMMSMPMGGGNMFGAFGGAQPPHSTFHDASGAAASSQQQSQQQYGYGANNNGGAHLLGGSDPIFGQANSGYRNGGGGRGKY